MKTTAGKIYPEYWVDCARCRSAHACGETNPRKAAHYARDLGWKKTRAEGWICIGCQDDPRQRTSP